MAEWSLTDPLSFVGAEETSVVSFLDHDVGNARPVILLQTDAGLTDGYQLWPRHLTTHNNIVLHFKARPKCQKQEKNNKKEWKQKLPVTHLFHLPLRHAATVVDDACGLEARGLVELDEQLPHHVGQVLNYLLTEELLLERQRRRGGVNKNTENCSLKANAFKLNGF